MIDPIFLLFTCIQCWFCAPFTADGINWDAAKIRRAAGDFSKSERIPARYGARLAQTFYATTAGLVIQPQWVQRIADIERNVNVTCIRTRSPDHRSPTPESTSSSATVGFTDGCGHVSLLTSRFYRSHCRVALTNWLSLMNVTSALARSHAGHLERPAAIVATPRKEIAEAGQDPQCHSDSLWWL